MMSCDDRNALDPAWDANAVIRDVFFRGGDRTHDQSLIRPTLSRRRSMRPGPSRHAAHDASSSWGFALVTTPTRCLGSSTPIARKAWPAQTFLSNRSATVFLAAAPCLDEFRWFARAPKTASDSAEQS